jgi:tRNA(Ile)-lysidine synthase
MLHNLRTILQQECGLDPSKVVLLALSGGPDSLCLLDSLWRIGYPIVAAHLNHGLRPEAGDDALAVKGFTDERGLSLVTSEVDVAQWADSQGLSVEEAARILRYRFLFEQAKRFEAQAVVVGHTADDQVETVLMHLLRGSGLAGLTGMAFRTLPTPWNHEIPLVRPLLGTWRAEIQAYLSERCLRPVQDASNLDTRYFRNHLRHELIPLLKTYNPRARQSIWRMAQALQGDADIVERAIAAAWELCLDASGPGYVSLKMEKLRDQSIGIQRNLLRRAIALLRPGLRDIDFDTIERGLSFLGNPARSAHMDLAAGLRLLLEAGRLWVAAWEADLPAGDWPRVPLDEVLELRVPGKLDLPGGWRLCARPAADGSEARQQVVENADPFQAWIDGRLLRLPLIVRGRLPGDRLRPLGMEGHSIKLSDLMINLKLPRRARPTWPLILSASDIVWIPGFRLSHPYRLGEDTLGVIHLSLMHMSSDG